jgi:hypothetical protein
MNGINSIQGGIASHLYSLLDANLSLPEMQSLQSETMRSMQDGSLQSFDAINILNALNPKIEQARQKAQQAALGADPSKMENPSQDIAQNVLQQSMANSQPQPQMMAPAQAMPQEGIRSLPTQNPQAGVSGLPSNLPIGEGMAGGGIIAFSGGGTSEWDNSEPSNLDWDNSEPSNLDWDNSEPSNLDWDKVPSVQTNEPSTGYNIPENFGVNNTSSWEDKPKAIAKAPNNSQPIVQPAAQPTAPDESEDMYAKYEKAYDKLAASQGDEKKQAFYMALIKGGLAAAGGTSPNALANIAQGAIPAMEGYSKEIAGIKKDQAEHLKELLRMGTDKEKMRLEAKKLGITEKHYNDWYKAQTAHLEVMNGQRADYQNHLLELRRQGKIDALEKAREGQSSQIFKNLLASNPGADEETQNKLWGQAQQMARVQGASSIDTQNGVIDWNNLSKK